MIVVLDSGVLGRFCAPEVDAELETWMTGLLHRGRRVVVPEICDYEIRREMIRNQSKTLALLDELERQVDYVPITTAAMQCGAPRNCGLASASRGSHLHSGYVSRRSCGARQEDFRRPPEPSHRIQRR